MSATALPGLFDELSFGGDWRRYQKDAIAAFERDRAAGQRRTHIVAPPGSGKTLVGVELVRRIGRRALVLTPNSAVQMQWPRAVRKFGSPADVSRTAGPEPAFPIAVMTYQSLCQLEDPEVLIGRVAAERWVVERAKATGQGVEEVQSERYDGPAAERRAREIARITAAVKREIARGEHAGVELADLLSDTARARVAALQAGRVGVVVLDECHHLASMWGYVVRAVLDLLGGEDVHVIGLTATPPSDLTGEETELYGELLGPVDFTVPTPAVVRDGHLAPYQELAWLTEPLDSERAWLAEHDTRFKELDHHPARRRRGAALVPRVGDHARARAAPLGRRRDAGAVGGVPARPPGAGARRGAVPGVRRAGAARGCAARRGLPARARPRRLAGAAGGLRAALPARLAGGRGGRPLRGGRRPRSASSASGSRARASAAARRRSTGC